MGSFKLRMHQNPFSAGAPPRTPLEELTTLPRPLVGCGGGHRLPITPPPRRLRRLDLVAIPLILKAIYANDILTRRKSQEENKLRRRCARTDARECLLSLKMSHSLDDL